MGETKEELEIIIYLIYVFYVDASIKACVKPIAIVNGNDELLVIEVKYGTPSYCPENA